MGNMDQNSEVLNRAIQEALKKVDRRLRLYGVRILILGGVLFLGFFAPSVFQALKGYSQPIYISLIVSISILIMIYGATLLAFGAKARSYFQRLMTRGNLTRLILYIAIFFLLVCFTLMTHSFFFSLAK